MISGSITSRTRPHLSRSNGRTEWRSAIVAGARRADSDATGPGLRESDQAKRIRRRERQARGDVIHSAPTFAGY